ncbi:Bcs1 protein, putative [Eimeria tenella]|uniref:Bcs1 protein, putative n=1 Tax=Eimeria tenella TaxID=5802 RepID=U6L2M6_EIMTE|nr:Bcs1 protein, putative [Eimeria tenella]CDJ44657.1 Bcs1 protein, putative [Eimeria tenella]|eukprot:XP_013235405.1 Bcs1 protein, putative [Eimeria tenella]
MEQQQADCSTAASCCSTPAAAAAEASRASALPSFLRRMLPDFLSDNPYFCAGFGLAGLGAAASLTRGAVRAAKAFARRRLLTSLEVPIRDPAYPWVMQWLVANPPAAGRATHIKLGHLYAVRRRQQQPQRQQQQQQQQLDVCEFRGKCSLHLGVETTYGKDAAGNVEAVFNFVPSPGQHLLRYKGALLLIDRQRSGEVVDFSSGSPWETLTLTTLSLYRGRITELLNEAREAALQREEGRTIIYRSTGQEWRKYGEPKKLRPFESVVLAGKFVHLSGGSSPGLPGFCLQAAARAAGATAAAAAAALLVQLQKAWLRAPQRTCAPSWPFLSCCCAIAAAAAAAAEGVAESILADVRRFLASSQWYLQRGIPYRRGYLLHGPPGCGKSSFVLALAGELKYSICVLNVADPHLTDDRLQYLLATVPPRSLLLLEDIDGAIRRSEAADGKAGAAAAADRPSLTQLSLNPFGTRSITFSGLLNALDGVVATEERIIFLTTNHPERLPSSLIRPGRVDLKVRVGFATPDQLRRQFFRFLPDATAETAEEFVSLLSPLQISMAELQGFFLFCRDDSRQALEMAKAWREADQQVVQEMQLKQQREMQQKEEQQQQQQSSPQHQERPQAAQPQQQGSSPKKAS